jgi:two-component system OmpR family response regulator
MVEDNDVIRANLTETLQELADVKVVGHADDALGASRWLNDHPEDWKLAIVDLFLRAGSGLTVLGAVRRRRASQRVIVVSNYATPEMRARCLAAGADKVFDKSTEVEALLHYCMELGA